MDESWYDLASDARRSASRLMTDGRYRSCISRAYYAAYAKVTHTLSSVPGITFPPGRAGPNHPGESGRGGIRRLVESSMLSLSKKRRVTLSALIGRLYTLRIDADYKPSVSVSDYDAREAISIMDVIFNSF